MRVRPARRTRKARRARCRISGPTKWLQSVKTRFQNEFSARRSPFQVARLFLTESPHQLLIDSSSGRTGLPLQCTRPEGSPALYHKGGALDFAKARSGRKRLGELSTGLHGGVAQLRRKPVSTRSSSSTCSASSSHWWAVARSCLLLSRSAMTSASALQSLALRRHCSARRPHSVIAANRRQIATSRGAPRCQLCCRCARALPGLTLAGQSRAPLISETGRRGIAARGGRD